MDVKNKALPAAGFTSSVLLLHYPFSSLLSRNESIPRQFAPCPDCTVSPEIAGGQQGGGTGWWLPCSVRARDIAAQFPGAATNSRCDLLQVGRVRPALAQHPNSLAKGSVPPRQLRWEKKVPTRAQQMGMEAAAPGGMRALQKALPKGASAAKASISNWRGKKLEGNPHTFYLEQICCCCLKFSCRINTREGG